jgi:aspartyl aminopeptidase
VNNPSKGKRLKEKLMLRRGNGAASVSAGVLEASDDYCQAYMHFLDQGKTERECVRYAVAQAANSGFDLFDPDRAYSPGDKIYVNNRDKAAALAIVGKKSLREGIRIVAAHIDSPRLDLKPCPLFEKNDLAFFKTHYYGGIKKYQWTALPLALHGRIIKKDGSVLDLRIGEEAGEPQFCVTDLLPHLAGEQMAKTMAKGIQGEDLNILIGSRPFRDDQNDQENQEDREGPEGQESDLVKLGVMNALYEKYQMVEADFISAELELTPAFKAAHMGFDQSMIGAYGQDDRVCAYPALTAILACEAPEHTTLMIWADKEEIGSNGSTGMQSAWIQHFVAQLAESEKIGAHRVWAGSKCLSADVSAAFDPTYHSVFDPSNSSFLNRGVVVTKYTGSAGKSNTSDASAEFVGEIRALLDRSEILWQTGELGKVDAGGGGTIAKYIANLNVDVVDIGVPVLSMHSPFEIVSKLDVYMMHRAASVFFGS